MDRMDDAQEFRPLRMALSDPFPSAAPVRALIFADMAGPSQALAFVHGLAGSRSAGKAAIRIIEEEALGPEAAYGVTRSLELGLEAQFDEVDPTVVVLSRFGLAGGHAAIFRAARARGLPVVAHIDDALLDLPVTVGVERYRRGRHPRRIHVQAQGLQTADLVLAASEGLAGRLARDLDHARIAWMENGSAASPPTSRPPRRPGGPVVVGYMGSGSHGPDLELAAPALNAILADTPGVRVELFGSIARTPAAELLPPTVMRRKVVAGDYAAFRRALAELGWDIGLAPLHNTAYNRCKTATKWVEYAEAGIAVVASDMPLYQPMIQAGAALAARDEGWERPLRRLIADAELRADLVASADRLLRARFSWERLEASVLGALMRASGLARAA
jgi:glycosyltransferase involved in cell wall biosynthesis